MNLKLKFNRQFHEFIFILEREHYSEKVIKISNYDYP